MIMRISGSLLLGWLLLLCCACGDIGEEEKEGAPPPLFQNYSPLSMGQTRSFRTDTLFFDPQGTGIARDTQSGWIEEQIVDTFTDGEGRLMYQWLRYQGSQLDSLPNGGKPSVYLEGMVDRSLERTQGNLRFKVLLFPPATDLNWDGHLYFDDQLVVEIKGEPLQLYKGWTYQYAGVHESLEIEGITYDSVLTLHAGTENLLEYRFLKEQYALGIGLIYREWWALNTQQINTQLPWEEKAEQGFIIRQWRN